ncbi:TPA: hypothetical protein ACQ49P_005747 [Pseudomonas aeruginosa]
MPLSLLVREVYLRAVVISSSPKLQGRKKFEVLPDAIDDKQAEDGDDILCEDRDYKSIVTKLVLLPRLLFFTAKSVVEQIHFVRQTPKQPPSGVITVRQDQAHPINTTPTMTVKIPSFFN